MSDWTSASLSGVRLVLSNVPEFRPTYEAELALEGGEMGPFQAVSLLASWTIETARRAHRTDAVRRALDTIELFLTGDVPMGGELAVEFLECIVDEPQIVSRLGPAARTAIARM